MKQRRVFEDKHIFVYYYIDDFNKNYCVKWKKKSRILSI